MRCATPGTTALTAVLAAAALAIGGCRDANREDAIAEEEQILVDERPEATTDVADTYAPALNVDLARMQRMANGVHYEDVQVGTGEPADIGRHVEVHYTSWLADGTRIASSRDGEGVPEDFVIGTGAVIIGWEEAMTGMRPGGRRRLVIPPALAYGREGHGAVPPYATLVIDVELIAVH